MRLHLITPLSRIENLNKLEKSVRKLGDTISWLVWWIVMDSKSIKLNDQDRILSLMERVNNNVFVNVLYLGGENIAGHAARNKVLNSLEAVGRTDDWIMSLDDDNIIHPRLIKFLKENQDSLNNYSGLLFDQVLKNGNIRLKVDPDNVGVNQTDTAQFMFKLDILDGLRFKEDEYAADGLFIGELFNKNKDKFLIINEPMCYYNYLRS